MNRKWRSCVALWGLVLLVAASTSALDSDVDPGPDGWAGIPLGASEATLVERFPEAQVVLDSGGDPRSPVPPLKNLKVSGQSVLGFEPCGVTFQLANGQLYQISFDCRAAPGNARTLLEQHFGEPGTSLGGVTYWYGKTYAVSQRDGLNVFGFFDRALNEILQQQFLAEVVRQGAIAAQAQAAQDAAGAGSEPGSESSP